MSAVPESRQACAALDRADPLARWRDRFRLPRGVIYLDGNSLGALPTTTLDRVRRVVEQQWGRGLVRSWNEAGWVEAPRRIGDKVAGLIGARPGEVIVADSTSVNVFKLLTAALRARPRRRVIVALKDDFPTDLYMAQGLARLARAELRAVPLASLEAALGYDVAVLMVTHVHYASGLMHDMDRLTHAAHAAGALTLWDLCHSAGAMPVDLHGCAVDLAVGCGYKYLNGGPGAPSFLFVSRRLQEVAEQPLSGWFGHANPFGMEPVYRRAPGISQYLCGTPPMLALAALEAGVDLWLEVGDLHAVRAKSIALGDLLLGLVEARCDGLGLTPACPADGQRRGSQVSLRHPHGYAVMRALIDRGVIGDFRAPDVIRFGLTPLYLRFVDVWDAVETLRSVLAEEAWQRPQYAVRAAVTWAPARRGGERRLGRLGRRRRCSVEVERLAGGSGAPRGVAGEVERTKALGGIASGCSPARQVGGERGELPRAGGVGGLCG